MCERFGDMFELVTYETAKETADSGLARWPLTRNKFLSIRPISHRAPTHKTRVATKLSLSIWLVLPSTKGARRLGGIKEGDVGEWGNALKQKPQAPQARKSEIIMKSRRLLPWRRQGGRELLHTSGGGSCVFPLSRSSSSPRREK